MLREAKTARFRSRTTLLGRRYVLVDGAQAATAVWSGRRFAALRAEQAHTPVPLLADGPRTWWAFDDRIWWEDEELEPEDVVALVRERERKRTRRLERAHAALAGDEAVARRAPIPREVRRAVWERDGGRCVACGADFELQFDHVIPHALGGADTVDNLQVLCAPCNQGKGASLG
jgi:hypothetical protein